jgi:hypothetical protein
MTLYTMSQSDLVTLFRSRARIARDAITRAHTQLDRARLFAESATWDAAATILEQTDMLLESTGYIDDSRENPTNDT